MAQTIQLKRSSVAGNLPTSSDLALGEIAINTADGAVYIKKGNNDIVAVADNDILHIDTTNSRVQVGFSGTSIDNHARLQIKGFSGGHARITMQDVDGTNQKTFFQQNNGTTSISTQNDTNHGNFVVQGWNGSAQAEFMRVVGSTGNVGIGTTSPSQKFTVENNSGIFRINTSTSTYPRIEIGSTSGTTAAIINRTTSTQNIIFGETSDSGNYAFRGGNDGIGTTSPGVHLDIEY